MSEKKLDNENIIANEDMPYCGKNEDIEGYTETISSDTKDFVCPFCSYEWNDTSKSTLHGGEFNFGRCPKCEESFSYIERVHRWFDIELI
jgi:transposase-like protein